MTTTTVVQKCGKKSALALTALAPPSKRSRQKEAEGEGSSSSDTSSSGVLTNNNTKVPDDGKRRDGAVPIPSQSKVFELGAQRRRRQEAFSFEAGQPNQPSLLPYQQQHRQQQQQHQTNQHLPPPPPPPSFSSSSLSSSAASLELGRLYGSDSLANGILAATAAAPTERGVSMKDLEEDRKAMLVSDVFFLRS
jgi:hypothetical protein